jgi:hypothetical protein
MFQPYFTGVSNKMTRVISCPIFKVPGVLIDKVEEQRTHHVAATAAPRLDQHKMLSERIGGPDIFAEFPKCKAGGLDGWDWDPWDPPWDTWGWIRSSKQVTKCRVTEVCGLH